MRDTIHGRWFACTWEVNPNHYFEFILEVRMNKPLSRRQIWPIITKTDSEFLSALFLAFYSLISEEKKNRVFRQKLWNVFFFFFLLTAPFSWGPRFYNDTHIIKPTIAIIINKSFGFSSVITGSCFLVTVWGGSLTFRSDL